ncbi:FAD-dependent oxidoreductase [Oricola sp.]|uniref:NAD(P)/FAD-dependent oxidoreductase n=1 Tax=Oricola sp. TaxID=1979950 RepID=UPI0025E4B725|nr:FAD-dependent oxidoreductase [Oricola sp.]MCI5076005.1 FAD-dependent oxidoreductase [Oricola sp.]
MNELTIIVGAGQAGIKAAETLRQKGHDGDILLIGEEAWPPYQRPPLSKAYLKGELAEERLFLKADDYFETADITLMTGARVAAVDPAAHAITLSDGQSMSYSRLLLTTGTRARILPLPGADLSGVHTLRGIDDTKRIGVELARAASVAIIGGGYIGMEFAAVARSMGKQVAVIEAQDRILKRSVAPEISDYFQTLHARHGVRLVLGEGVAGIAGTARAEGVELASGEIVPADLVLVAVGAAPVTELADAAGLAVDRGIVVDEACRTSAPDIFAAGDCTVFPSQRYGRRIGLESVQNAADQAKAAALSMLGEEVVYDPVPWFWSDQYDVKLQIAGLAQGYDRTELVGDPGEGRFALRYFAGDTLLAVDAVNDPRSHMMARKQLAAQAQAMAA